MYVAIKNDRYRLFITYPEQIYSYKYLSVVVSILRRCMYETDLAVVEWEMRQRFFPKERTVNVPAPVHP